MIVNTFFAFLQIFVAFSRLVWYNTFTEVSLEEGKGAKKMTIGEKIKARRIELGLSVDEVAERIGKNRATVYRYEKSDILDIPSGTLELLAKTLHTTPEQLLDWGYSDLTTRELDDVALVMNRFIAQLGDPNEALMFDGEPLDDESRDLLLASLENSLKLGKMMAKKKFTPDKYKK